MNREKKGNDLLAIGAAYLAKQSKLTAAAKAKNIEAYSDAEKRLKRAWIALCGEHEQAIKEACDSADLESVTYTEQFDNSIVCLRRGRRPARIEIDTKDKTPMWRPYGDMKWRMPNTEELIVYIWSCLYDEHEQRTALHAVAAADHGATLISVTK